MDTSGFYCFIDGEIVFGPNFVDGPGFDLVRELKDTYSYPVDGWRWFDSKEDAYTFFDVKISEDTITT